MLLRSLSINIEMKATLLFSLLGFYCLTVLGQHTSDVVFKKVDTVSLRMSVYYPSDFDKTSRHPAMIFFFGGGWYNGSLTQFEEHAKYFSKRGIVCFLPAYRVQEQHGTTPFQALMDAKSAIRYLRQHAVAYRLDTAKIIAAGGSAGGQLAAATALIVGFNENTDDVAVSCVPNALVLFNPVIDNGPGGFGYERVGEMYKDFSPLHNIRKGAPPTIIFLGTEDHLVPVETARYYKTVTEKVGSRCELVLYKGKKHGFFNFINKAKYQNTVYKTDVFLQSLGYVVER